VTVPIGGEPVLFTHNENSVPRWFGMSSVSDYRRMEESITMAPLERPQAPDAVGQRAEQGAADAEHGAAPPGDRTASCGCW